MNARLPQRDENAQLEAESEIFLRRYIPGGWTWEKPQNDYGIDIRLGVVRQHRVTGREVLIQLKSAANPSRANFETIRLRIPTYNHLMDNLAVVMLVKFISAEQEAYWTLLRDVPRPNPGQQSFTVRISKENRISQLDWREIDMRINRIHDGKLGAGRRER
jgi:hypothetical protein